MNQHRQQRQIPTTRAMTTLNILSFHSLVLARDVPTTQRNKIRYETCWTVTIFSNYWMRLSRIWRILQIKEGVIHRGQRPRWITISEIWRILHILRKPNSIIALLFIQNISPLMEFRRFALSHSFVPRFFGQRLNNLQRAPLLTSFWRQRLNNMQRAPLLTSLIEYDEDSFQFWWTAAGYGELCVWFQPIRKWKYFEWIIIAYLTLKCSQGCHSQQGYTTRHKAFLILFRSPPIFDGVWWRG